jgi:gliding motility-associated-like protein
VAGGKLFLSDINKLYSLDTATFQATHAYTCTSPGLYIYGMANYNDFCNAPRVCNASVKIAPQSPPPFCQNTGISLNAEGSAVEGTTNYTWWQPDGTQVSSQKITAMQPGKYKVRYHTLPDTCEAWDTITIRFIQPPVSILGTDTFFCNGSEFILESRNTTDVTNWIWSDGSTGHQFITKKGGDYWLQLSNACGVSRDTIHLSAVDAPRIELGRNRELCMYDSIMLFNLFKNDKWGYTWSDGTHDHSMMIHTPGWYWLEAGNACGITRDSIRIIEKQTGCACAVYVPNAFSPGTQSRNQKFRIKSGCPITGELCIYNRWGQVVYQSSNLSDGWDGRIKGILQQTGVYVFQLKYQFPNQKGTYIEKGTLILVQ